VRVADQFLFGYDDGHRLLAGSRELPAETAVALLSATDAAMPDGTAPLVTGLALPDSAQYAFCVTWSATELPRPGAVWAHALLVSETELAEPRTLEVLLGLPRRPSRAPYLGNYRAPIELADTAPATPSYLSQRPLDRELLARLAFAAYDPQSERTVAHEVLGDAAKALLALWRAQWPALRAGFSFRTREVVRSGAPDFDVTVTRKIRGHGEVAAAAPAGTEPWLRGVVDDAAAPAPTPLRDFLWAFGPSEPRDPRRLAALARLWPSIVARNARAARAQLEREWPDPQSGAALKRILFGGENDDWWRADPPDR
jgi:hypothetical protein